MPEPEKKEEIKAPEKKTSATEQAVKFDWEKEKKVEKKEVSSAEKAVTEELKREIELMQLDDNLKAAAEQKANKIKFLADDDKLKELLKIAKEKGVLYAIETAKKMNEPYLLDVLHDILAKEGYYHQFIK